MKMIILFYLFLMIILELMNIIFHQIRLWNESFINTHFLRRVYINKPSNFPNFLHLWIQKD